MKNDNCEAKKIEMVNISVKLDTCGIDKKNQYYFVYFRMDKGDSSRAFDLKKSKGIYENDKIWINKGFKQICISGLNLFFVENVPPINDDTCFCYELTKMPKIKKVKTQKPAKKEPVAKK